MKIAADGWVYEAPAGTEFIEVCATTTNARAKVAFFDESGDHLAAPTETPLSELAPVPHWTKRIAR